MTSSIAAAAQSSSPPASSASAAAPQTASNATAAAPASASAASSDANTASSAAEPVSAAASAAPAATSASTSAAAAPAHPSRLLPGELAWLVDHYLATTYPKVRGLFRLEARKELAQVTPVSTIQSATPRALADIVQEYSVLKERSLQHNALVRALRGISGAVVSSCSSASSSSAAATDPISSTVEQLATLLGDYSALRREVAANPDAPPASLPQLLQPRQQTKGKKRSKHAASTAATTSAAGAPSVLPSHPHGAAAAAESSSSAASPSGAVAEAASTPNKRRRKRSPQRRIMPQPVAANVPSSVHPAFAAATSSSSALLPGSPPSLPSLPLPSASSSFSLPTHLPLRELGPEAFVNMSVDIGGYEQLYVEEEGGLAQGLAEIINRRAVAAGTGVGAGSSGLPSPPPAVASSSSAAAAAASSSSRSTTLSPSLDLSDAALRDITEQLLRDPATAHFLDLAFKNEVGGIDAEGDEGGSMYTPSLAETPMNADMQSPPTSPVKVPSTTAAAAAAAVGAAGLTSSPAATKTRQAQPLPQPAAASAAAVLQPSPRRSGRSNHAAASGGQQIARATTPLASSLATPIRKGSRGSARVTPLVEPTASVATRSGAASAPSAAAAAKPASSSNLFAGSAASSASPPAAATPSLPSSSSAPPSSAAAASEASEAMDQDGDDSDLMAMLTADNLDSLVRGAHNT